jgi:hypothetical protein
LYDILKEDEVSGVCGTHWKGKKIYRLLVEKAEAKRPSGRPKR